MMKTQKQAKRTLGILFISLACILLLFFIMIITMVNRYQQREFDHLEKEATLFTEIVKDYYFKEAVDFTVVQDLTYEELRQSSINQNFEADLRSLMQEAGIERVYYYEKLEPNEVLYYEQDDQTKPLTMKYLLEGVVDIKYLAIRDGYLDDHYRYDTFDRELSSLYEYYDSFARVEKDLLGNHLVAHSKILDQEGNVITYIGVEISLENYDQYVLLMSGILWGSLLGCLMVLGVVLFICIRVYERAKNNRMQEAEAFRDPFTGLYNRFIRRKLSEIYEADKKQDYLFMLIDIHELANLNKVFGRKAGEELIKYVARAIKNQLRGEYDIPIYLGEDDFGVIIQDEPMEIGMKIARRIQDEVYQYKNIERVGLCIGITTCKLKELTNEFQQVYSRADGALFEAKKMDANYKIVTNMYDH